MPAGWNSETAIALASALRCNSSDGLQYGHRSSSGLSTMSPRSLVIKLPDELAGRVINDCAVPAFRNLEEDLPNDRRFARAGVADSENVLVFGSPRNAQRLLFAIHRKADPIAVQSLGKLTSRYQKRAFQAAAIAQLLPTSDVLPDRER